jgi:hypothetical protein
MAKGLCRIDRVKAHLAQVGHARNVPLADVAVERRLVVEQGRHARHRCGVPVGDWAVRCRRGNRIGQPSCCGRADVGVGDGGLRSDVRGEEEEQREAGEAVRSPHSGGPTAQEATRHAAPLCDTLQRGMYMYVSSCNKENQVATLRDAPR